MQIRLQIVDLQFNDARYVEIDDHKKVRDLKVKIIGKFAQDLR